MMKSKEIIVNILYTGEKDNAQQFITEMYSSGIVDKIRNEEGNLQYEYFLPFEDSSSVLLIDRWKDQASLDVHHQLPHMNDIMLLREKYNLHMKVLRYRNDNNLTTNDDKYIRK